MRSNGARSPDDERPAAFTTEWGGGLFKKGRDVITIGASSSYALTGRSKWATPFTLYHELTAEFKDEKVPTPFDRPHLYFGIELEPTIRKAARDHLQTNYVGPHNVRRVCPLIDYMHATPDSMVLPSEGVCELFREHGLPEPVGSGVLELKTSSPFLRKEWDPCPDEYAWQVAHQCVVCDCDWGIIAALIGGRDFRLIPLRPSQLVRDAVVKLCWDFIRDHLEPRIPPEPDATPRCGEILASLYPQDDGESIEIPVAQSAWVDAYAIATEKIKRYEAMKQEAKNHLQNIMGEASELTSEFGRFTWKKITHNRKAQPARTVEYRRFCFHPERTDDAQD